MLALWTEEPQRSPSIPRKRPVSTFLHVTHWFYFPHFLIILAGSGTMGCSMFFNRMPGVMLAFVAANIFKMDECQGYTPGDTWSQWGGTTCESRWFLSPLFAYLHGGWQLRFPSALPFSVQSLVCWMRHGEECFTSATLNLWAPNLPSHKFRKLRSVRLSLSLSILVTLLLFQILFSKHLAQVPMSIPSLCVSVEHKRDSGKGSEQ